MREFPAKKAVEREAATSEKSQCENRTNYTILYDLVSQSYTIFATFMLLRSLALVAGVQRQKAQHPALASIKIAGNAIIHLPSGDKPWPANPASTRAPLSSPKTNTKNISNASIAARF